MYLIPARRNNLTKLNFLALEGTHGREAMGGHCGPGKSFKRFLL